jgi:uracil-DNA glycosylase
MTKSAELSRIAREIEICLECQVGKHGKAVPGEGDPDADVAFIGEAPGKTEADSGRPFVGRSGQLLRRLIRETGLKEAEVFITSPVKYLPDRGTPTVADIDHGKTHLDKQLAVIKPKVVVLLGSVACKGVLGEPHQVLREHGSLISRTNTTYMITVHPAAVLRFPKYREIIMADFQKLKNFIRTA